MLERRFKNVNRVTYLVHNENTKFPCPLLILHHLDYTLLIWTTKEYICACEEPTNLFIITIIIVLGERFIRFYWSMLINTLLKLHVIIVWWIKNQGRSYNEAGGGSRLPLLWKIFLMFY